jgi:hypothetical protein
MKLLALITPVEIGLSIGFFCALTGSLWFCLKNYAIDSETSTQLPHNTES